MEHRFEVLFGVPESLYFIGNMRLNVHFKELQRFISSPMVTKVAAWFFVDSKIISAF